MKSSRNILIALVVVITCYISIAQAQEPSNNNNPDGVFASDKMMSEPVANTLYGHSVAAPSHLYTIDSTTGMATLVGSIGYSDITDVAFRDNVLYGITFNSFVAIDPATGSGTLVGPLGYAEMNALAVSDSGVFYAASTSGAFINIDEETGTGIYIGDFGSGLDSSGDMAFAKNGILYASINRTGYATDWLANIDLQSGQASLIGDFGYSGVYGLSFLNDQLYGVTTTGLVLQIDTVSGVGVEIGANAINFGGLTTSPDAIPLLELPYDYTGSSFIDESRDNEMPGGRISSYFDHQYPTYCNTPNNNGCVSGDYRAVNFHGYDGGQLNLNQPPYRVNYNGHDGIDFALPGSPQVLAAASGIVTELGYNSTKGNYVSVGHSGGYTTSYYHLDSFAPGLHVGSIVTRTNISDSNAFIGIMGSTGNSGGAHIHFMVKNAEGVVVDPYGWKPKVDSAWYGMDDPWVNHNANLPEPKDGASHYLWLHPLGSTAVAPQNTTTIISSPTGDTNVTFFAGAHANPMRIEFEETLNQVVVNGTIAARSFFVMAYQDDIVPLDVLDNDILIEYIVPQERRSAVSNNSKFVVWNPANASWQTVVTEWNPTTGRIRATSSQLGTFALVNFPRAYLPIVKNNGQSPTLPSGQVTIFDGFTNYGESGFRFSSNSVVAWDSNAADLLAAKAQASSTMSFFLPYDAPPYNNPDIDKDARSGIIRMSQTELEQVSECPESGYEFHWVEANLGSVYCVQTRDGEHYAIIKLTSIGNSSLSFTWKYQPDGSRSFH